MKTYLVTGGAGFIGSNFVKYVLKVHGSEARLVVLDALTYAGNLDNLREELKLPNLRFVKGDIGDSGLVGGLLGDEDPDFVVNFAAESHVDRSIANPRVFLETNVLGTFNMLECCRRAWLDGTDASGRPRYRAGKRFLQISTDEVYGSLPRDPGEAKPLALSPEVEAVAKGRSDLKTFGSDFFSEETPLSPHSPYSAAKTSADLMTLAYRDTYGLPVNITRCSNNYGPYHFPEKLIPLALMKILRGEKIPVYARGENVRDWLYVEDHCKAVDMVLRNGAEGEVYNVGGFNEEQNISIVRQLLAIVRELAVGEPRYRALLSRSPEEIGEDMIEFVADRPGHDMRYAINPAKIATTLGWYPETPFSEGLRKTVKWYLDNPEWAPAALRNAVGK